MPGYQCATCGEFHPELPMHFGPHAPFEWYAIPEAERAARCELNADLCVIDRTHFYILGNIEIPVIGSQEHFSWDVWVSLSDRNFLRTLDLWETAGRESEPPMFGWLCNELPGYPSTLSLKTMIHTRAVGVRPYIQLEPTDHPLAVEQRTGITLARVQEIAEMVLHES